jgi:hypothetical protein
MTFITERAKECLGEDVYKALIETYDLTIEEKAAETISWLQKNNRNHARQRF